MKWQKPRDLFGGILFPPLTISFHFRSILIRIMQDPCIFSNGSLSSIEQNKLVDGIFLNRSTDFQVSSNQSNPFYRPEGEKKAKEKSSVHSFPRALDDNSSIRSEGYPQTAKRLKVMPLDDITNSTPISTQYI